ncbi:MAG: ankyrin repeat domain-containing protein [Akkermansia sp.]|nr:ankyrin repeat domain-containing protein [Akkermansia sp.]
MKKSTIIAVTMLAAWAYTPAALADDDAAERACKTIVAAAARGEADLQKLIAGGHNVNMTDDDGETPLMRAAERGNLRAVDALIKAGANVNAKDEDGNTALMDAADEGHNDVVLRLIQAGADVNARDDEGETALSKAIDERHTDTATLLRSHNAQ